MNELINNSEFEFSQPSKEILLLRYETWFKYLMKLERFFITHSSNEPIAHLLPSIKFIVKEGQKEVQDVMTVYPELFNPIVREVIEAAHKPFINRIYDCTLEEIKDDTMYAAFPKIVSAASNSIHNLLFVLHEYECLSNKIGKPFLSYTPECEILARENIHVLLHRANVYKKYFGVNEFIVKNYSHNEIDDLTQTDLEKADFKFTYHNPV